MKDRFVLFAAVGLFLLGKLLIFQYDLFTGDEGVNLFVFWRASLGELVYRDFSWNYGPLAPFIFGTLFNWFGVSVQLVRLVYIFVGAIGVGLAFRIARFFMPPFWAGIASLASFSYLSLPPHSYNHIFGTLSALWVVALFLSVLKRPGGRSRPFWMGLGAGVGLLTKPLPMGVGIFGSVILFVVITELIDQIKRNPRTFNAMPLLGYYGLGAFCLVAPFLIYLLTHMPAQKLLMNLFPTTSGVGVWRYHASYPNLFSETFWSGLAHLSGFFPKVKEAVWHLVVVSLWWSPVVCAGAGFLFFRKDRAVLFLSLFSVLIYAQPLITGSNGIGFLLQVPFVLLIYFFYRLWNLQTLLSRPSALRLLQAGIACFVGYFILFSSYVDMPLQKMRGKVPLSINVARGIQVPPHIKKMYEDTVTYIRQQTAPQDGIFVVSIEPIYYFLSQRDPVVKDEFVTLRAGIVEDKKFKFAGLTPDERTEIEEDLINQIRLKRPKCIIVTPVTYFPYTSSRRRLFDFIEEHYVLARELGDATAFAPKFTYREIGGYFPYYGIKIYCPKGRMGRSG